MKRQTIIINFLAALIGSVTIYFSRRLYFTGMIILFILNTLKGSYTMTQTAAETQSSMQQQSKLTFTAAMFYVFSGILTLLITK